MTDLVKVLVLEDNNERIKQFKQRFLERGWYCTYVDTADDCLRMLKNGQYDLIFLDHDLGGEELVNTDYKNCGSEVARQFPKDIKYEKVIIHSLNTVGAEYMKQLIPNSIWAPFIWTTKEFTKVFGS